LGVEQVEEIEAIEERVTFVPPPELAQEMARRGIPPETVQDSSRVQASVSGKLRIL
jgi:hypothetical protein